MKLQERIELLVKLGQYMQGHDEEWIHTKHKAFVENNWFIPEFVETAIQHIATNYLQEKELNQLVKQYQLDQQQPAPKKIGLVLTGVTPLAGFHDILSIFLAGHYAVIKTAPRDEALIKHLVNRLHQLAPENTIFFSIFPLLKGCDAYIATNTKDATASFNQYFSKFPNLIRRNKTSVGILNGKETTEELEKLADDIHLYFGLGPRNVTKLFIPENYDFVPLLNAFNKYEYFSNHHKFKNNYDYNLSVQILNHQFYMTNGSILLTESTGLFSPISQLFYEFYTNKNDLIKQLELRDDIEFIVSEDHITFGEANYPAISVFEKGGNTLDFLESLNK